MTTYQEALAYLEGLDTFGIKLGLTRIEDLLERMGRPQTLYKTIHVTGTNGKGSTTAMLTEILSQAKIKVGMYTSPHLVSYTERIQVGGQEITESDFAAGVLEVKAHIAQMVAEGAESPTQFEVLTAAAFAYFAKMQVEYAVIEVGLGGLLDSTNVILPEVSVITNVTLEHADRCGGTLLGVAEHKAGIIKEGVPVVTATKGEPLEVIRRVAREKNADIFVCGEEFQSVFEGLTDGCQNVAFSSDLLGCCINYPLRLLGLHQIENSAVAVMTALVLAHTEKRLTKEAICQGLATVSWGGRFELMRKEKPVLIIDGAHNPAGAKMLRENLDCYFPGQARVLLLGILKDKDVDGIVQSLIRPEDIVVVTQPNSDRAAAPDDVAEKIAAQQVEAYASIERGLLRARQLAGEEKLLCVAGSLYLVGAVRQHLLAHPL